MRTALMDGDVFAFEAACGVEEPVHWGDGLWTLHAWEQEATARLRQRMARLQEIVGADQMKVCLSDSVNWRMEVLPTYKEQRKFVRKPMLLRLMRQVLVDEFGAVSFPELEGDDVLGIWATRPPKAWGETVIVTSDKDMKTIPGLFYRITDDRPEVVEYSEADADRFHLMQALAGDPTDGYFGCPGIGMTVAERIVDGCEGVEEYDHTFVSGARAGETVKRKRKVEMETPWEAIVSHYALAGFGEEYAIKQAQVARICRADNWDFRSKKVIPWQPNN